MTSAKLQIYRDIFEDVIAIDPAHASLLHQVKAVYDLCVAPWISGAGGDAMASASTPRRSSWVAGEASNCSILGYESLTVDSPREDGSRYSLPMAAPAPIHGSSLQISELELENRLLRTMCGQLHLEKERLQSGGCAQEGDLRQKEEGASAASKLDLAAEIYAKKEMRLLELLGLSGLQEKEESSFDVSGALIGSQSCVGRSFQGGVSRPFSAMRCRSRGVSVELPPRYI